MIRRVTVKNFKKIKEVTFDLSKTLVVVGPNNSGKTTLLQALSLWEVGMKKIYEQKEKKSGRTKRVGIAINRKELLSIPVSSTRLLWFRQAVREMNKESGELKTSNIRMSVIVEGVTDGKEWVAPVEFDYPNTESIYCRQIKLKDNGEEYGEIPEEAFNRSIAFLQPMSGISTVEDKLTKGSINVRIGEGKTADVLRNICYQLYFPENSKEPNTAVWKKLNSILSDKFGIVMNEPNYIPVTGTIELTYKENGIEYDLSSSGRGFQQTLLLLAYLFSYPNACVLLDEPDAHLEVIRQRETYELVNRIAAEQNSQLIIASHSEVVLNQAAEADYVLAICDDNYFPLNDERKRKDFRKLLTEIGWDKYYLAKTKGHILFLEGPTDLRILTAFANLLQHPVYELLEKANIHYTGNVYKSAYDLYNGLASAVDGLKAMALYDRLEKSPGEGSKIVFLQWMKREIENYFCFPEVLVRWAVDYGQSNLFTYHYNEIMSECIQNNTAPADLKNRNSKWWSDNKMSEDYLQRIFEDFFDKINSKQDILNKGHYYELVKFLDKKEIDTEVIEKLDTLYKFLT